MATKATLQPLTVSQQQGIYALARHAAGSLSGITQRLKREEAQALGLTKTHLGEMVYAIAQVRAGRFNNQPRPLAWIRANLRTGLRSQIAARLTRRLVAGFSYRQPETKWIDISNTVAVNLTQKSGEASAFFVNSYVKYHPKHNWKANETAHVLRLNPLDDFTTVGGLLTIFRKADRRAPAIPCRWYEQSRGFEVKEVVGYLVGDYHIEAESAEAAALLAKRRNQQAAKARQAQADLAEGKDNAVLTAALVQRAFGFCLPGIRSFCEANGLDATEKYTLRELRAAVVQHRELNCRSYASYLRRLGIHLNCA